MSVDEYNEMLEAQGGGCAICGRAPRPDISLHVDHEHEGGRVRGLPRFPCNQAIGLLGDEPSRCRDAASYLTSNDPEAELLAQARARVRALGAPGAP